MAESSTSEQLSSAAPTTVHGLVPEQGRRSMLGLYGPYKAAMSLGVVILLITNGCALLLPSLINESIELIEGSFTGESMLRFFGVTTPGVGAVVTAIIGLAIVGGLARVASRVVLFNIGRDVEREIRAALFSHLSTLSPTYFGANTTGDLMSRMTNDINNVRLMTGFALLNLFNAAIIFVGTLPLLFRLDVKVALLTLIPFPLVMGAAQILSRTMYKRVRDNQEALGALTGHLQENLAGQQVVRAFSQEEGEQARFAVVNEAAFDASMRLAMIRTVFFPLMGLMSALGIAIALYAGGAAVVEGRLGVGDIVEFNTRLLQLTWPAIAMGFTLSVYQRGRAGLSRINEVFSAQPDVVDGDHGGEVSGRVVADKLTVTYPKAKKPALKDLSFTVEPGQVIGLVGRNASGKSTVVRAVARMLPLAPDTLLIDDVCVTRWKLADLRSKVAVVTDDGFLFSATLRENLTFARPDATDEEVEDVLVTADLARDVAGFPDGLKTIVGERGVTLSGGQKQRVALARALLARPRVLVLDDSLSAVDAETEANIVSALRSGKFGAGGAPPTLIVISHRLSAVREADEIVVLEEGEVLERGTHDALLEHNGRYADLWGREQLLKKLRAEAGIADPSVDESVDLEEHRRAEEDAADATDDDDADSVESEGGEGAS
jgi:ATP-binding cassette subfamily B multidrug efflux pump